MKTKLSILLALLGLSINVASANGGSASVGYSSDYFREGALVSQEAMQASAAYTLKAGGLDASVGIFTSQPIEGGTDTYIIDAAFSKALNETFSVSLGLEHAEFVSGVATLDVTAGLTVQTLLSPSVTLKRDTEDELYVIEIGASHQIDLQVADLGLSAIYGNTDVTTSSNIDYYSLGANLSRSLSENSTLNASLEYVDSDSIQNESIFGLGLTVQF